MKEIAIRKDVARISLFVLRMLLIVLISIGLYHFGTFAFTFGRQIYSEEGITAAPGKDVAVVVSEGESTKGRPRSYPHVQLSGVASDIFRSVKDRCNSSTIELLTQDSRSKSSLLIHGLGMIVCLVFMISSYCFILQPEYPAPDVDENGEPLLGSEDITIFKEADGTYSFHVDGTDIYIPISEEEAEFNLEGGAKLVEKD